MSISGFRCGLAFFVLFLFFNGSKAQIPSEECDFLIELRDKNLYQQFVKAYDENVLSYKMLETYYQLEEEIQADLDKGFYWDIAIKVKLVADVFNSTVGVINPGGVNSAAYRSVRFLQDVQALEGYIQFLDRKGIDGLVSLETVSLLNGFVSKFTGLYDNLKLMRDSDESERMLRNLLSETNKKIKEHNKKMESSTQALADMMEYKKDLEELISRFCMSKEPNKDTIKAISNEEVRSIDELLKIDSTSINYSSESSQFKSESAVQNYSKAEEKRFKIYLNDHYEINYIPLAQISDSCTSYRLELTYLKASYGMRQLCIWPRDGLKKNQISFTPTGMSNTRIGEVCIDNDIIIHGDTWERFFNWDNCK